MTTGGLPIGRMLLLVGLLPILGCGESSAPTGGSPGVSFSYAGTLSGRFLAVGPASDALDPSRSFAVAFRGVAGELQLCAYQAGTNSRGNFLLVSAGPVIAPGKYPVPPDPAPTATSYQPGTFLVGVEATRMGIDHISTFTQGTVTVDELSTAHVRGTFSITSLLTRLRDGQFDVPMAQLANLPVLCQ